MNVERLRVERGNRFQYSDNCVKYSVVAVIVLPALAAAVQCAAGCAKLIFVVALTTGAVVIATATHRAPARGFAIAAPCQGFVTAGAFLRRAALSADTFIALKAAVHVSTFGAIVIVALAAKGAFVVLAIWAERFRTAEARARGFTIVALAHGLIAGSA